MDKKMLFNDALASLVEFASKNANHISKEDIHTFFHDIITDESQYEFIYKYLQETKIKVDGMDYIVSENVTMDPAMEEENELATVKEMESKITETETELAFIEMYKNDLVAITPASDEEIRTLLQTLKDGDSSVVNRLLETQLSTVADIASTYRGQGVTYGDLIQEANIGLMLALSDFNGSVEEFSSFIQDAVHNTLSSVVNEQINEDRVGAHLASRMNELDEVSRELTELLGRAPSFEELAQKMGISTDEVETVVKTSLNVLNSNDAQDEPDMDDASADQNFSNSLINNTDDEFESAITDMGDPLEWKINK